MILNDLYPQLQGHVVLFTLNVSETVGDTDIVSMEYTPYSTVSFRMILSENIQWHEASRGLIASSELLVR